MDKHLEREIRITYADCQSGDYARKFIGQRRLDWKAAKSVSGNEVREALLAACEGYNCFDAAAVASAIVSVDPKAKVYVAREGSVCLYVVTDYPSRMKRNSVMKHADEVDTMKDGSIRFWWD